MSAFFEPPLIGRRGEWAVGGGIEEEAALTFSNINMAKKEELYASKLHFFLYDL
jgi:hypothetical protein